MVALLVAMLGLRSVIGSSLPVAKLLLGTLLQEQANTTGGPNKNGGTTTKKMPQRTGHLSSLISSNTELNLSIFDSEISCC